MKHAPTPKAIPDKRPLMHRVDAIFKVPNNVYTYVEAHKDFAEFVESYHEDLGTLRKVCLDFSDTKICKQIYISGLAECMAANFDIEWSIKFNPRAFGETRKIFNDDHPEIEYTEIDEDQVPYIAITPTKFQ